MSAHWHPTAAPSISSRNLRNGVFVCVAGTALGGSGGGGGCWWSVVVVVVVVVVWP